MVMGTWIWGFVLFDTMASEEGVGKGVCVLVGIVLCPFFVIGLLETTIRFRTKEFQQENSSISLSQVSSNPMWQGSIEMLSSEAQKCHECN
jgi:hypothetical protein